jgi:hypothetical protein
MMNILKRFVTALCVPILACINAFAATPLYGVVMYANNWTTYTGNFGLYSFTPGYTVEATKQRALTTMSGLAGDYVNGKYCYVDFVSNSTGTGATSANFNVLDLATDKLTTTALDDALGICTDMAYDVTTQRMFGCSAFTSRLIETNPATGQATSIATIPYMMAMACSIDGALYGIALDEATGEGMLYGINKLTGETTLIGATGVTSAGYLQSATFDKTSNRMYWVTTVAASATDASMPSQLYRVDTSTGRANYMATFPNAEEFVGLYCPDAEVSPDVPASVCNVVATATTAGSALAGSITFTAPTTTRGGEALTVVPEINIYRGASKQAAQQWTDVAPGSTLSWTDSDVTTGYNTYRIVTGNQAGSGVPVYTSFYAGADVPAAVTDFNVELNASDQPVLTWKAPKTGLNGTVLDAESLTFTIYRATDADNYEVIASNLKATTYVDEQLALTTQTYVTYKVVATSTGGNGIASTEKGVVVGPPYTLPFAESFADTKLSTHPWLSLQGWGDAYWELHYLSQFPGAGPSDDDYGMAVFRAFNAVDGSEARLVTPAITLQGSSNPMLTFDFLYFYMDGIEMTDRLEVEVSTDGGATFTTLPGGVFVQSAQNTLWTPCAVSLADYCNAERIQLAFHGIADHPDEIGADLSIDNILIADDVTSLENVSDTTKPTVTTFNGVIAVTIPVESDMMVCRVDGTVIAMQQHATELSVAPGVAGIYVVRVGAHTFKVRL